MVILLLSACANPIPPSGGPEDTSGPGLNTLESTPNEQTNFRPKEIILTFDEWIKLSNPATQILISPPLQKKPSFKGRGKEVIIEFDEEEELKENTTYTIQFGESIQDITESNPTEDFRFIFSTGPVLDSLELSGQVVTIDEKTPAANSLVMLYTSFEDSIVFKEKPAYATKTDENGNFTLKNLRADSFKVVALLDENRNYLFDPDQDAIAFNDEIISLSDTSSPRLKLIQFKQSPKFRLTNKKVYRNKVVLTWEGQLKEKSVSLTGWDVNTVQWYQDSAIIWTNSPIDSTSIIIDQNGEKNVIPIKKGRRVKRDTMGVILQKNRMTLPVNSAADSLFLLFNRPITNFESSGIFWKDSSGELRPLNVSQIIPDKISLSANWEIGTEQGVIIVPGALTNINQKTNKDTIRHQFFVPKKEKLGNIFLEVNSLGNKKQVVLELIGNSEVIKKWILTEKDLGSTLSVTNLRAGKYKLNNIIDSNENGQWDSGDYLRFRQPEKKWLQDLEPLRENWDLKVELEY